MCRAFIFNSRRLNRPERETVKLPGSPFSNKKIYLIVFTDVFLFPKYILRLKKKKMFPCKQFKLKVLRWKNCEFSELFALSFSKRGSQIYSPFHLAQEEALLFVKVTIFS